MIYHPKLIYSLARARYTITALLWHRKVSGNYVAKIKRYREQYRQINTPQQFLTNVTDLKFQVEKTPKANKSRSANFLFNLVNPEKNRLFHSAIEIELACKAIALAAVAMERAAWPSGERIILHDNQLEAAFALADGHVIQMDTGEGKTYVGAVRAFLNALWGRRTTIVTPNSYLAARDAQWMTPFYRLLGMSVSCADQPSRSRAYFAHVCYVSLTRLVTDYLSNIQAQDATEWNFIALDSVIIDEVDAVLLDSGSFGNTVYLQTKPDSYQQAWETALQMTRDLHYKIENMVSITEIGYQFIKERWEADAEPSRQAPIIYSWHVLCALQAREMIKRDADYIVEGNKIRRIDQKTGRPINSQFALGVQQALEKKENLPISPGTLFIYTIHPGTILNQANNLCGMSGSAMGEQIAFRNLFGLPVVPIPSNKPSRRIVHPDEFFINKKPQLRRVCDLALQYVEQQRPVLIGTQSIEQAEELREMFKDHPGTVNIITARNHFQEAVIMEQAGQPGVITIAARMAGRGVDIKLDPQVQEAGGLVVISVGRYTLRRLDEQLMGRTGRQGYAGDVFFILSMEDELFRLRFEAGLGMPKNMYKYMVDQTIEDWDGDLDSMRLEGGIYGNFIKMTQAEFRDQNYRVLSGQLIRDQTLSMIRSIYEYRRYLLLSQENLDNEIKNLLSQVLTPANLRFIHDLETWADTHVYIPENKRKDAQAFAKAGEIFFTEYSNRREQLGEMGRIRERIILLRGLDFQWALLYLDWQKYIEIDPPSFSSFKKESIFLIQRVRLFQQNYAEHALEYLFQIGLDDILQQCYYWRGTLIPVGSYGKRRLGGDVGIPEEAMFQVNSEEQELLRRHPPRISVENAGSINGVSSPLTLNMGSTRRGDVRQTEQSILMRKLSSLPLTLLQIALIVAGFLLTYFGINALRMNSGLSWEAESPSVASILSFLREPALRLYIPLILLAGLLFFFPARKQTKMPSLNYYMVTIFLFVVLTIGSTLFNRQFGLDAHLRAAGYGLALLLADMLLGYGGIHASLGVLAVISFLYLRNIYQLHDVLAWTHLEWLTGGILLFTAASTFLKNRVQVTMLKDWMPTSDTDHSIEHTYAINTLDTPAPLISGFVWTLLALELVNAFYPEAPSWVRSQAFFIGLFIVITIGFALQAAKWKLAPTLYNNIATYTRGVVTLNRRSEPSENIVKILRRHLLMGWLSSLLLVSALLYWRSGEVELSRLFPLVTTMGVIGVTLGLCLRYLLHRFNYWVDSNDLMNYSYNEFTKASFSERVQAAARDPLYWLTWGSLAAMVTVYLLMLAGWL